MGKGVIMGGRSIQRPVGHPKTTNVTGGHRAGLRVDRQPDEGCTDIQMRGGRIDRGTNG